MQVLSVLPRQEDDNLMVAGGPDDAGVYRLDEERVMIQSVDFFTPIVDDPADYGRIAAANSVSDIYAMGGSPSTGLNVVGVPLEQVGRDRLGSILAAAQETMNQAGGVVLGGHTVKTPEPLFGMAVTGFAHPDKLLQNAGVSPGEKLILTKPLGTGIVTTAFQQQDSPPDPLAGTVEWMSRLNDVGPVLAGGEWVSGMTDITGYGLLGHCLELLGESAGARIRLSKVPVVEGIRELIEAGFVPGGTKDNWEAFGKQVQMNVDDEAAKWILSDAQTSGGLLLSVPDHSVEEVQTLLGEEKWRYEIMGEITDRPGVVVKP